MKIAMLGQKGIPAHSGGVEQHVDVLSKLLVQRGHEVTVYCRRSYCGKEGKTAKQGLLSRVFRPSIPTKHLDAISHTFVSTLDVVLRRADVVHYHAIGPAALSPIARMAGLPVVATVHGLDWQRGKWGPMAQRCLRLGQRLASFAANKLVVVSPTLKDYFAKEYRAESEFIPNGVMPLVRREPNRMREFGITPGNYVLAVARLVPEKGLHYLAEAFRRVPGDTKLVIAGGGGFDGDYERKVRENCDPRVVFTGPADRVLLEELYSHAKLFCLPSDLEGMSIALLEAMSMRLPVLVSDIPENTAVTDEAGATFRAGDVEDLTRQLNGLLAQPERLAELANQAVQRVEPFRWESVVEQLERVYESCLSRRNRRIRKPR